MKKITIRLVLILAPLLLLSACGTDKPENESTDTARNPDTLQVVTSIFPVYEITKEIAGEHAEVSLMVGESEDAHHYEPSAQAVAAVNEADVFIYSSEVMEFWVEQLLAVVENEDLEVVNLAYGLDLAVNEKFDKHSHEHKEEHPHDHGHGGLDPHFWLDPVAVSKQLPLITDAFNRVDASNEASYRENEETFQKTLNAVDEAYQEAFFDAKNRDFVVQHEAFGHLANRYQLNQVAVGGLTTEVEPNPRQLAETIEFVRAQAVPVIYYQSGENSAIAETVAKETDKDIAVLYDLENAPASLKGTSNLYLEAMQANLEQLQLSVN